MTTVPGTSFPFASVTVKVGEFLAEDELTVSGSIGWLKVALTAVPVTTLSLVFVLVGTFVALLLGLDETTVGSVTAPTRVPGATVTPGSTEAKTLPIPPTASKAANSSRINIGGLYKLSNLIICFPSFVSGPSYLTCCVNTGQKADVGQRMDEQAVCIHGCTTSGTERAVGPMVPSHLLTR
jgi:hypothetical protein